MRGAQGPGPLCGRGPCRPEGVRGFLLKRSLLLGTALAAALAGGRLAAPGTGDAGAELLARALAAAMPPGSDFRYDRVDTDPADGAVRFTNLAVRLGPEAPGARRARAAELSVAGLPQALASGRIASLRARGLVVEDATGRLGLASLAGTDLVPAALVAFFTGRPFQGPAAGRVALEGLAFGSGAETIAATRAGWESLGDEHLAGLAAENLVVGDASGRLEAQRLALASLDWARVDLDRLAAARARVDALRREDASRTPGEEAEFALSNVEMALDLAGGELGGLDLAGLAFAPSDPGGAATHLGRLTVAELSRRRLGPLSLDSLAVADPEIQVGLAGLRTDTVLDRFPLDEMRAAVDALPRSEEGVHRLPDILDGVEGHGALGLASLAVTRTTDGAGLSLAHLDLAASGTADRSTATLAVDPITLDLARLAGGVLGQPLAECGLERLSARLRAGLSTDTPSGRVSLDNLALDLDGLAALE